MTCDQADLAILDSLASSLSSDDAAALERHIASCERCAKEAVTLREWWTDLAIPAGPVPRADLKRRLLARAGGVASTPQVAASSGAASWRRIVLTAAAVLVAWSVGRFAPRPIGGGAGDRAPAPVRASAEPSFLLLILGEGSNPPGSGADSQAVVDAHRRWAIGLAREGRLVSAGKLSDRRTVVPVSSNAVALLTGEDTPTGYFVVRARSLDDALRIAATSPHIRHGGRIEVRPIDQT